MTRPTGTRLFTGLTGNVLILGLVSFLTDVSSEMIYPLLPLFLTMSLGAGPAFLGIIEGIAESTASFLKLFSGVVTDRTGNRKGLVLFGYGISSLARPLVAFAGSASAVLAIRCADRIGKGVRTSPRDALIADSIAPDNRGKAYGFHRSMDHAGALVGPLLASLIMYTLTSDLRTIFLCSVIPGMLAVVLIAAKVREVPRQLPLTNHRAVLTTLPAGRMRAYLAALVIFTLGNSSDAFLLLKASHAGMPAARIGLLWSFFHLVKMTSSLPFGSLSDRIGRRKVIVTGWVVYAAAYAGFALAASEAQIWLLFGIYGLFYGLTEGTEKAFVADLSGTAERGAAFGWYHFCIGIGALPASIIFGAVWQLAGSRAAFATGALLATVASIVLVAGVRPQRHGSAP